MITLTVGGTRCAELAEMVISSRNRRIARCFLFDLRWCGNYTGDIACGYQEFNVFFVLTPALSNSGVN